MYYCNNKTQVNLPRWNTSEQNYGENSQRKETGIGKFVEDNEAQKNNLLSWNFGYFTCVYCIFE